MGKNEVNQILYCCHKDIVSPKAMIIPGNHVIIIAKNHTI